MGTDDVQLKRRRYDSYCRNCKGYAKHEKETLEGAIRARNSYVTVLHQKNSLRMRVN